MKGDVDITERSWKGCTFDPSEPASQSIAKMPWTFKILEERILIELLNQGP